MNRTALITGGTSGIGLELAKIHAERGGDLVIVSLTQEKLEKTKKDLEQSYNCEVQIFAQDLSQPDAIENVIAFLDEKQISIDYLINNAGFGSVGSFGEMDIEKQINMINLNVVALVKLTHALLPQMKKRGNGHILNVGSTAGLIPGPMQAVYYATKSFVNSFSNALSIELENTGVSVTALLPGATETNFGKKSGMDKTALFDNPASAQSVAHTGYNAMMKGDIDVLAGLSLPQSLLLKLSPLFPKKLFLKQIKKMQTPGSHK